MFHMCVFEEIHTLLLYDKTGPELLENAQIYRVYPETFNSLSLCRSCFKPRTVTPFLYKWNILEGSIFSTSNITLSTCSVQVF